MKNTAREVLSLAGIASPSMTALKLVVSVDCGFKAGADLCLEPQHRHGLGFQGLVAKLAAPRAAPPPLRKI
jgi:hypothetical protein